MHNSHPQLSNAIRTSKYTLASFLPMNFLYQLSKMANIYFIFITCIQMIKPISITMGQPTMAPPLLFVLVVSMIKDYFEDRTRQKADDVENNTRTLRMTAAEEWVPVKWKDVKVGDILKVMEDEGIPADMVLLQTAQDNISYVETKDIDGETNLKLKSANMKLSALPARAYEGLQIQCEPASDKIYSFTGVAVDSRTE